MNAEHIMRDGLAHTNMCLDDAAFFTLIDSTGGWPLGFQFVGFGSGNSFEIRALYTKP